MPISLRHTTHLHYLLALFFVCHTAHTFPYIHTQEAMGAQAAHASLSFSKSFRLYGKRPTPSSDVVAIPSARLSPYPLTAYRTPPGRARAYAGDTVKKRDICTAAATTHGCARGAVPHVLTFCFPFCSGRLLLSDADARASPSNNRKKGCRLWMPVVYASPAHTLPAPPCPTTPHLLTLQASRYLYLPEGSRVASSWSVERQEQEPGSKRPVAQPRPGTSQPRGTCQPAWPGMGEGDIAAILRHQLDSGRPAVGALLAACHCQVAFTAHACHAALCMQSLAESQVAAVCQEAEGCVGPGPFSWSVVEGLRLLPPRTAMPEGGTGPHEGTSRGCRDWPVGRPPRHLSPASPTPISHGRQKVWLPSGFE